MHTKHSVVGCNPSSLLSKSNFTLCACSQLFTHAHGQATYDRHALATEEKGLKDTR
jgi:hypothetical protein